MEDPYEHFGPPPDSLNPYQASSNQESYQTPPMTTGNGNVALWLGVASLVCGVVGVLSFCCILFGVFNMAGIGTGIFAIVLGLKEQKAVAAGYSHHDNQSPAKLGVIFGSIGIGLSLLSLLAYIAFMVFFLSMNAQNW